MRVPRVFDCKPDKPDPRDWKMADYLSPHSRTLMAQVGPFNAVDTTLAAMRAKKFISKVTLDWAEAVTSYLHAVAPKPPAPVPVPTSKLWFNRAFSLDQGNTGHCVGYGWSQWGNTTPVEDFFSNADANTIYYECKTIDGEPGQENGSEVRSGAKAMQARGKLMNYVFATTVSEIKMWLLTQGPVVVGTNWYTGMLEPNPTGLVHLTGNVEGRHCWVLDGYNGANDIYRGQNSWGDWGPMHGYFYVQGADLVRLLSEEGDACAALELTVV